MGSSAAPKVGAVALIILALFQVSAQAAALDPSTSSHLLRPRDTCGGSDGFFQCGSGLPSGFCCATGTVCLTLNNTATAAAICCPAGKDCTQIQPITCDTSQQDASKHPTLPFHMADTGVQLQTCGSNCCPLGYSCDGGSTCKIMASTQAAPSSSLSSSSSTTSTSSASGSASAAVSTSFQSTSMTTTSTILSSSSSVAPVPTASLGAADSQIQTTSDDAVTGKGFAAGFFPGIVLGILATIGILWFLRRRQSQRNRESGDTFIGRRQQAPKISEPIYQPQMGMRTDFLSHQRGASADGHAVGTIRPVLPSSALRGRSPASFISAPLGGSFASFPSEPISQRQQPSSGATLTDESSFQPRMGHDVTPTPAPRRKSLPKDGQYLGMSLSLDDFDSANSLPRGGKAPISIKVNVNDRRISPKIKRKRGTPTLGKGARKDSDMRDSVNTHRRGSSGGETIEISMGMDRPEAGPLRPRQSSYYPPQASDPNFLGSGPRYTIAATQEDEFDPRRQTTYSDVMRAVGARESQMGTPKSPPPMPILPSIAYDNGQPPKLGSPWKPLRTNKQ